MSKFKFRGWDEENQIFIYAELLPRMGEPFICTNTFDSTKKMTFTSPKLLEWNRFSGLKDRNGKDIYEGDILRYGGASSGIGEVIWRDCGFTLASKDGNDDVYIPITTRQEVIGNIYEKPEILDTATRLH